MKPVSLRLTVVMLALAGGLAAQQALTLAAAEQLAIKNHPQLASAQFSAQAAQQDARSANSAFFPTLTGNLTSAAALSGSRLAAGALNNPSVLDRAAGGVTATQLITDFGRTSALVQSARQHAQAAGNDVLATRAAVLLGAAQAYYAALRSQSLLAVATDTVQQRQRVVDQTTALERSQLRTSLDVSFANVNLAQAQLALADAQGNIAAAQADLARALGLAAPANFQLTDQALPAPPATSDQAALARAARQRPELAALASDLAAQASFARAESDLAHPTLSAAGSAGLVPWGEAPLLNHYAAAGVNLSIPIFNGFQFSARQQAAKLRTQAANQDLRLVEDQVARDVQVAWLNARTAYQRLPLTQDLLDQATLALQLAQSRYDLGLSTMIELGQAQLNLTAAQTQRTDAVYGFQQAMVNLQFQTGDLR